MVQELRAECRNLKRCTFTGTQKLVTMYKKSETMYSEIGDFVQETNMYVYILYRLHTELVGEVTCSCSCTKDEHKIAKAYF